MNFITFKRSIKKHQWVMDMYRQVQKLCIKRNYSCLQTQLLTLKAEKELYLDRIIYWTGQKRKYTNLTSASSSNNSSSTTSALYSRSKSRTGFESNVQFINGCWKSISYSYFKILWPIKSDDYLPLHRIQLTFIQSLYRSMAKRIEGFLSHSCSWVITPYCGLLHLQNLDSPSNIPSD